MKKPPMPSPRLLIAITLLFSAYFITARFGQSLNPARSFASFVWPPAGIAVASIILFGYGLWPAVALGALAANLSFGVSPIAAFFIVIGNTLEAIAGAWFLRAVIRIENSFGRLRDATGFICTAIGASLIAAVVGPLGLLLAKNLPPDAFLRTVVTWWVGDALGILVIAPVILTWFTPNHLFKRFIPMTERILFVVFLVVIDALVFSTDYGTQHRFVAYLALFPLIWSSLRFGSRGKTIAIFLTSVIATSATIFGSGPFHNGDESATLFALQTFVATVAIIFLLFGSVAEEWVRARDELEEYIEKLEHALQENREGKPNGLPETELTR